MAQYQGGQQRYPGVIVGLSADGKYVNVDFDDGDREDNIHVDNVKVDSAPRKKNHVANYPAGSPKHFLVSHHYDPDHPRVRDIYSGCTPMLCATRWARLDVLKWLLTTVAKHDVRMRETIRYI